MPFKIRPLIVMAALIALFDRRQDWTAEELGESPANVLAYLQEN